MEYKRNRILFIGHSAGRTGAPLILLNLLRWIKEKDLFPFEILLKTDGVLRPQYEKLAPTEIFYRSPKRHSNIILNKIVKISVSYLNKEKYIKRKLYKRFPASNFGLIFMNTITNGDMLSALTHLRCPMITRVAELNYEINRTGERNFSRVKCRTDHFIAVSQAVKENLVKGHGIPLSKISVIPGFVSPFYEDEINQDACLIRRQLNIPNDDLIVCGSGEGTWRKGKDLFVQLAACVSFHPKMTKSAHFVWVGGKYSSEDLYQLQHDAECLGVKGRLHWVPEVSNPMPYFAAADIFAMVSREDPFPIVCLEAAWKKKPIVCFRDAGGVPELVGNDAGFSVPYLDLKAMADRIVLLSINTHERIKFGHAAALKVNSQYTADKVIPSIVNVMEHFYSVD